MLFMASGGVKAAVELEARTRRLPDQARASLRDRRRLCVGISQDCFTSVVTLPLTFGGYYLVESLRRGQSFQVLAEYGANILELTGMDKLDLAEAVQHDGGRGPADTEFQRPAAGNRDAQRLEVVVRQKRNGLLGFPCNVHEEKVGVGMQFLEFP